MLILALEWEMFVIPTTY